MKKYLCVSSLVCLACGGKAIDLGENGSGWVRDNGTATTATVPSSAATNEPVTLYDGVEPVQAIAVDETTIAASIYSAVGERQRIDVCQLADCHGTQQTIRTIDPYLSSAPLVLISHGEVIWAETGEDLGTRIMACSTNGCPEGPRQIVETGNVFYLAADASHVYLIGRASEAPYVESALLRCPRAGCNEPTQWPLEGIEIPKALAVSESTGMLYASYDKRIARMPADFSAGLSEFYVGGSPLGGLALAGEKVYFAVATLLGQIRSCSATECGNGSELVTNAPLWPHALVADEKQLYWFHSNSTNVVEDPLSCYGKAEDQGKTIAGITLEAGSEGADLPSSVESCSPCGLTMNSRSLFWCDPTANWSRFRIRMLAR
jgi:hypothetical protein